MCEEDEIFDFLELEAEENNKVRILRKRLRDQCDPFDTTQIQFVKRYRLSQDLVRSLCDELRPHHVNPLKETDLSLETKMLVALSFYATGSYQRPVGDIAGHSVAQPTVSVILKNITNLLNLPFLRAKYIKFPRTPQERRENCVRFFNNFGIPGVLGCIDCTHVAIVRPTEHEERFYCRKQYHSLNVQLVCNADMDIISVDASNGGATHDSFIWEYHPLKTHLEEISGSECIWLLGDSGYPQRKYLMTPITDAAPNTADAYYTNIHVRTRNVIERTIGLLKARFRCLLVHRVLHYSPYVAGPIVNACVLLHNLCNRANMPVSVLSQEESMLEATRQLQMRAHLENTMQSQSSTSNNTNLNEGLSVRRSLINRLWNSRQP